MVEQIDRISRLNEDDWELLKNIIVVKGIMIVSLDIPTSHQFMYKSEDEFTSRMLYAVNGMLLDMLAAISRKDFVDRRRRQSEGIQIARDQGKYKGRQPNQKLHDTIVALLQAGKSYSDIVEILNCSRSTIAKVKKTLSEV